jgi:hypothetical protein
VRKASEMTLEITEPEKSLLLELIESAEQAAIQGLDHADTRAYKDLLRNRLDLLELLKGKVQNGTGP